MVAVRNAALADIEVKQAHTPADGLGHAGVAIRIHPCNRPFLASNATSDEERTPVGVASRASSNSPIGMSPTRSGKDAGVIGTGVPRGSGTTSGAD